MDHAAQRYAISRRRYLAAPAVGSLLKPDKSRLKVSMAARVQ